MGLLVIVSGVIFITSVYLLTGVGVLWLLAFLTPATMLDDTQDGNWSLHLGMWPVYLIITPFVWLHDALESWWHRNKQAINGGIRAMVHSGVELRRRLERKRGI